MIRCQHHYVEPVDSSDGSNDWTSYSVPAAGSYIAIRGWVMYGTIFLELVLALGRYLLESRPGFSAYHRRDRVPIFHDPGLYASPMGLLPPSLNNPPVNSHSDIETVLGSPIRSPFDRYTILMAPGYFVCSPRIVTWRTSESRPQTLRENSRQWKSKEKET